MMNKSSRNNTELEQLQVILDLVSKHFTFLYKNFSLELTLLIILDISSQFKYLSMEIPKYFTTSVELVT